MESARDKHTREIVEAEDLWLLDSVDTEGYMCWGCGITMHPAAWEKDKKVRAYFKRNAIFSIILNVMLMLKAQ
ncbi:hypothetical protein ACRGF0_000784 [Escherichia coli]